jgi:hypothetical protein
MRSRAVIVVCCMWGTVGSAAAAQGLTVDLDRLAWPQWRARLQLAAQPIVQAPLWSGGEAGLRPRSGAVFSDYYVASPQFGQAGGLRVTSGVVLGPRGAVFGPAQTTAASGIAISSATRSGLPLSADANGDNTLAWPYVGVGYSDASLRGGWGFSADLGLAAQNFGLQRAARSLGNQSLDDFVRDLRLTPVLQLGVSYRF